MKKRNWKKIEKRILIVETVFVVGILIYLLFSTMPSQIYPLHGMTIENPNFVFEIENGEKVILSVNENFENFITLEEGSDMILPPGDYYWKVRGRFGRESEVKIFSIQDSVGLDLRERKENYELENSGNVDLEVTKNEEEEFDLEAGEYVEVEKDDSKYEGGRK